MRSVPLLWKSAGGFLKTERGFSRNAICLPGASSATIRGEKLRFEENQPSKDTMHKPGSLLLITT